MLKRTISFILLLTILFTLLTVTTFVHAEEEECAHLSYVQSVTGTQQINCTTLRSYIKRVCSSCGSTFYTGYYDQATSHVFMNLYLQDMGHQLSGTHTFHKKCGSCGALHSVLNYSCNGPPHVVP